MISSSFLSRPLNSSVGTNTVAFCAPEPRAAMADSYSIVTRMAADIRSMRIDLACVERFHMRRFGWSPAQIDACFQSACAAASKPISL